MELFKDIEIIDLCLYLRKKKILVIGDMHIGLEESLQKQGILIPKFDIKEVLDRLDGILKKVKVKKIILIGDVKHEFGSISDQEWRDTLKILDYLLEKGEVVLIKGNHDTVLGPISDKRGLEIKEKHKIGDILFVHGDKLIKDKSKLIVIGHEHPAISFEERRDEKFKCFLLGKFKGKELIVLPSFNFLSEGSDVTKENGHSPYIKGFKNFKVFIPENGDVREFGKVKDLE
jgi:hypothetical protein|tara:strand:+ start:1447 stop:2139 length:693 start_codon:yes stop_codon:yes gene_type:complete